MPVHVAEGLTDAQKVALRIRDNRSGEISIWDDDKLVLEFGLLKAEDADPDAIHLTGFSDKLITTMLENKDSERGRSARVEPDQYLVVVACADEKAQEKLYEELTGRDFECKLMS